MEKRKPRWPLATVKRLVADGRVALTHSACEFFASRTEALMRACAAIQSLRLTDFAHSSHLAVHDADIYGVTADDHGWYLKLTVVEELGKIVLVISFHPLDQPLRTRGGMVEP
jgi:hypothetical protein